jgi:hypothetical protein
MATRSLLVAQMVVVMFIGPLLIAGCRTTPYSEESFRGAFDAEKVRTLAHEAYALAWRATRQAQHDLRYAAFIPRDTERAALYHLDRLSKQVGWIARQIENHPATPRASSKQAYDIVAFEATQLRMHFQPSSFKPTTNKQVQDLLLMIDEIASYYQLRTPRPSTAQCEPSETLI